MVSSYQNEPPRGAPESAVGGSQGDTNNLQRRILRMAIAGVVLGGALVIFNSVNSSESYETIPSGVFDQVPGGIMGSSHHKQKAISGLTMKGYPPLSVQQEYWEDLQKIDWRKVEADMKDLLTDSKECECE